LSIRELSGQMSCLRREDSDVRKSREERGGSSEQGGEPSLFGGRAALLDWDLPDTWVAAMARVRLVRIQCRVMMRLRMHARTVGR